MNILSNVKVGTKIITGYAMALILMALVGGVVIIRLNQIVATVNNLDSNLAINQKLAEEMSAQVEEVTASAQSLAEMAQALQQVVARFKLSTEQHFHKEVMDMAKPVLQQPNVTRAAHGNNGHANKQETNDRAK